MSSLDNKLLDDNVKVAVRCRTRIDREIKANKTSKWDVFEEYSTIKSTFSSTGFDIDGKGLGNSRRVTSSFSVGSGFRKGVSRRASQAVTSAAPSSFLAQNQLNNAKAQKHSFQFDNCYDENANNEKIFKQSCAPIVQNFCQGYNGSILCYGQTSSGKTYTMSGAKNVPGIIDLTYCKIRDYIQDSPNKEFYLTMSYIEIYKEKIADLLSDDGGSSHCPDFRTGL